MSQLATSQNGKSTEIPPMRESHRKRFELAMQDWHERQEELDQIKAALQRSEDRLHEAKIENGVLRDQINSVESRAAACQAERDEAVVKRARLETLLRAFGVPMVDAGVPGLALVDDHQGDHIDGQN